MVDEVGIIHMNGRIYDAELGRFLQADPFIDGVTHTQGYNRYAYGKNNPLNGTDPSGFGFFKELFDDILGITESPLLNAVAQIAACYYGGPAGCAEYALMSARGHGGSWGDAFKAAATAYVSASVFEAIGQSTQFGFAMGDGVKQLAMNALANGTAGGVMSVLQGGKFGHGFAAAGLSSLAKPALRGVAFTGTSGLPLRVLTRAVIGGTLSELTGGKFANGAVTAAFSQLFKEERTLVRESSDRTTVELRHKNIPGGDSLGNTNPKAYPQHAYVIVRDNVTGEEWIVRAGPGGDGGNRIFGSVKAIAIENVPNTTPDYGAQVIHSQVVLVTDVGAQTIVDKLSAFTISVNQAKNSYNPLIRNSNSFAYQAVEELIGVRPRLPVWAPGSRKELRISQ